MYKSIMVAIDNSEWSEYATDLAIHLARAAGVRLTGCHVYAAALHSQRFRQVEPGLPERYQTTEVLEHQRSIHEDLIGRGLEIITDSYLDAFAVRCRQAGLEADRRVREGRNYEELIKEVGEGGYDLVVIGAHGLGKVDRSIIGSVCERVARMVDCDLLAARQGRHLGSGPLMVAIDGSPHSFAALRAALFLSRACAIPMLAVAAYDPFFHGVAFRSIVGVLSAERAQLFRFEAQQRLHDEIIDQGLAQVYGSHLLRAQEMAQRQDRPLEIKVLEGKPFDAIADEAQRVQPSLLLVGRHGAHRGSGVTLGSTAENLLRFAGCNVLVVSRGASQPEGDGEEETDMKPGVRWSEEARQRLERVPSFARVMARKAIENWARERGHTEITLAVYEEARQHFRR